MFCIESIKARAPGPVVLEGFVHALRRQGRIAFIVLRSRLDVVQCVAMGPHVPAIVAGISAESCVRVRGTSKLQAQAPHGVEVVVESLEVLAAAASLPIDERTEASHKARYPAARLRQPRELLPLLASAQLESGMRAWLGARGFVEIHTPKIMAAPSESGAEVFGLGYFGQTAYLAQSPQFYKQMAIVGGMERVFEIGPVFRAEPSFTGRHATEFTSVDVELQGERCAAELAALEHEMLVHAFEGLASALGPHLARHYPSALEPPGALHVMTHAQACDRLGLPEGTALGWAHERALGESAAAQGAAFCAIVGVPWSQRPFYHRRLPAAVHLTDSFELLYRGMEITTGAMREHRHARLLAQLAEKGLSGAGAEGYLESFQWGAPPHGGFGLGLARLVALHLGLPSIREASFLHRTPKSIVP
jgi:aspartyl-tRNA synthetase